MSRALLPFVLPLLLVLSLTGTRVSGREAAGEPVNLVIGGRTVIIPPPEGFVRVDGLWKVWDDAMAGFLPETNRLLAKYSTPEGLKSVEAMKAPEEPKEYNVQVLRNFEGTDVGSRTFSGLRRELSKEIAQGIKGVDKEMSQITDKANDHLEKTLDLKVKLSMGKPVQLGSFVESDEMLGFSMLMAMSVETENGPETGGTEQDTSMAACLMIPVNGRLLYLYHTVPWVSGEGRKPAEDHLLAWGKKVLAANPAFEGPPATGGGFFSGVGRAAWIGAVAGGLAGLLLTLRKKFKARSSGPRS